MAAAAAAAAAAQATIDKLHASADKQLETMYKAVSKLKDVGYHKFVTQLQRHAYAYGWAPEILTFAVMALTPAQSSPPMPWSHHPQLKQHWTDETRFW